jgi:aminodeoxyfutalosine deaminase
VIDIITSPVGRVTFVEVDGRIDSINASLLQEALAREIEQARAGIIVDMADVTYMSAAGLRVLKFLYDKTGTVHIARPSPRVREVLQITGLGTTYKVYETRVEAIHTLAPITNAHTHLELGWLANYCPDVTGAPFLDWITGLIDRRRALGTRHEMASIKAIESGIQALIDAGTTMVGDISLSGLSIEPLLESGLKGVVYVELLGHREADADARLAGVRAIIDQWRPKEKHGMRIGLTIHTPYTVHPTLWKKGLDYARAEKLPLCIHVAESPAEQEFMLHDTGPVVEFQTKIDARFPSPKVSSVRFLDDIGALALKPLLVHAVQVDDDDIKRIKDSGSSIVHCPRSNLRLRCGRMPLEKFLEQGIPVYLGTDSLSSSPSLNIFDELEVATALHFGKVAPEVLAGLVHRTLV